MSRIILVTGATGRQGKAFISALNSIEGPAFRILALTRKPTAPSAKELALQKNVTVVQGDLDSPDSTRTVFEKAKEDGGIWGIFCVLAFPGLGVNADGEERQGKLLADTALEFGVSCFVFSSVERGGENYDDKLELGDRRAKVNIERHIRELGTKGLHWTILRPGFFMENYEGTIGSITASVLKAGLKPTTKIQLIAIEDIGHIAAAVFCNPEPYNSQVLLAVGDVLTTSEQEAAYKTATGRSIPAIPAFLGKALIAINGHTKNLIADIERVHRMRTNGECPDEESQTTAAKSAYPDLKTFEAWAAKQTAKKAKDGERKGRWNNVTVAKLVVGKQ